MTLMTNDIMTHLDLPLGQGTAFLAAPPRRLSRALRTRHSMLNSKKNWGYLVNCLKWRIEVLIGLCNLGCISART